MKHINRSSSLSSKNIAIAIAQLADAKKAEDIVILDMRKVVNFCDYFVIGSAHSERQVSAIAEYIEESLKHSGMDVHLKRGLKGNRWVVFDTGSVVVHIFHKEAREFYGLEYLWQEAKKVKWP